MGQGLLEGEQADAHSKVGTRGPEAEEVAEREVHLEAKGFAAETAATAGESKAGTRAQ